VKLKEENLDRYKQLTSEILCIQGRGTIKGRGMIKGRHLALYQIFKTTVFTTKYMIKLK
jgi:hypothetical protein